jgi:hypothetical protein
LPEPVLETKKVMGLVIEPQATSRKAAAAAASRGMGFERIGFSCCGQSKRAAHERTPDPA